MLLGDLLDVDLLQRHVAEGLVAAKEDPIRGMTLFNYTPRAAYSGTWDPVTMACRGLVTRADGWIQSRPFPKFFNLSEHTSPALPDLPVGARFTVYEKLDGSLIIVSAGQDGLVVTTRGSFTSKQAAAAEAMLLERGSPGPAPGTTWLLELIAPWNRVVVDYGERTDLVFLGAVDNETGDDFDFDPRWTGTAARVYDGLSDVAAVQARLSELGPNDEGFVIRFATGLRAKAKGDEYIRLHKLLTGVTSRTIYDLLRSGTGLDTILGGVPDEFYAWVRTTADELLAQRAAVEAAARATLERISGLPTRKDQAMAIADDPHKAVVFALLDGKDHDRAIWRGLRPERTLPYVVDEG
jgi:RNA ligase